MSQALIMSRNDTGNEYFVGISAYFTGKKLVSFILNCFKMSFSLCFIKTIKNH